jgi:GNAT superfamily N-acetyltransferase
MRTPRKTPSQPLEVHALTPERWADLETLFGHNGACGGCWCMYWRLRGSDFGRQKGEPNRQALRGLVQGGQVPGLLAYSEGRPVGWIAIEPREAYPRLERSRVLKPLDPEPVWSVTCFFVARPHRRKGVTVQLLRAAVEHARRHGARIVEGYPVEPKAGEAPDVFVYTGLPGAFRKAGFREAARRSDTRPIYRYHVQGPAKRAKRRSARAS